MKRKPRRKDLLVVIGRCQDLFGKILGAHSDRNPNRAEDIHRLCNQGFNLCIEAAEQDEPAAQKGPWTREES
jgi:hypothetical protein